MLPIKLADKLHREDERGGKQSGFKLGKVKRYCAQHTSAKVDKDYLYHRNCKHYKGKGTVAAYARKEIYPFASRVEAIEDGGKYEKGKKCGQQTNIILRASEMRGEKGVL